MNYLKFLDRLYAILIVVLRQEVGELEMIRISSPTTLGVFGEPVLELSWRHDRIVKSHQATLTESYPVIGLFGLKAGRADHEDGIRHAGSFA